MAESLANARHHIHITFNADGKTPQEISQMAKEQVKQYPTVQFYEGSCERKKTDSGFIITTNTGEEFSSRKLF
jgi:thioredoxin reductase